MQENHVSMHKTYVYTNQTMLYLHTHFLEYTETFLCPHSVFHLQQSSLDWLNYFVYVLIDFSVLTQGCVSACVKSFLLVEKVTFWITTCLHHLIDLIVFLEQLSTICRTKVGMSYKAILQHDRWGHAVIGADLHTEISKSWHVNFR